VLIPISDLSSTDPPSHHRLSSFWCPKPVMYPYSGVPADPIPWEDWGPPNTRWFAEWLSTDWQHALYGLKTVECIPVGDGKIPLHARNGRGTPPPPTLGTPPLASPDSNMKYIRVRDYNPYAVRELINAVKTSADSENAKEGILVQEIVEDKEEEGKPVTTWQLKRVVVDPWTTPSRGVFAKDIMSWLPYTEVVSTETFDVTDVMMDDRRILLMKVCPFSPRTFILLIHF
jgi:hypothetical protein